MYDERYNMIEIVGEIIPWEKLSDELKSKIEENLKERLIDSQVDIVSEVHKVEKLLKELREIQSYVESL